MRAEMERPASPQGDTDAERLLAETLKVPLRPRHLPILGPYIEGRTRYFDRAGTTAVQQGSQIVTIGAGYDDRSLRFGTAGVQFIEVDHPATQRDKLARLEALGIDHSDIGFVAVDLARDRIEDALAEVIDPDRNTAFVCEAVVPYLRYERVRALLAGLTMTSTKGATLYLDAPVRPDHPLGRVLLTLLRLSTVAVGEPIRTILTGSEMDALITTTGWREKLGPPAEISACPELLPIRDTCA